MSGLKKLCNRLPICTFVLLSFIVRNSFGMPQAAGAHEQKPSTTNVWEGVYTAAQAQRGNVAYLEQCAKCHRDDLSGYQSVLKSDNFMQYWREDNLQSLYTTIKTTMPRGAPASLSDGAYLEILTFWRRAISSVTQSSMLPFVFNSAI